MAIHLLTEQQIKAIKPTDKLRKFADGGGLHLVVEPNGRRWWRFGFTFAGKESSMSLGEYGPAADQVDLDTARKQAAQGRADVSKGVSPVEKRKQEKAALVAARDAQDIARQAEKAAQQARDARTKFRKVANDWRQLKNRENGGSRSLKSRDRDERMLAYLNAAFGDKAMEDITAADLIELLNAQEAKGQYETRIRLQSAAIKIASYAVTHQVIKISPFAGIDFKDGFTPNRNEPRHAVVDRTPFGELLRKVAGYKGRTNNMVGRALELTCLVFLRPGNICEAKWEWIDFDRALMIVPFNKLKQRTFRAGIRELAEKPHYVPLSRQALVLLRELHKETGKGEYLFPSREGPLSTNALEEALIDLGYRDLHVPTGFRSSASTILNSERVTTTVMVHGLPVEHEVPRFDQMVVEYQLEHVTRSIAAIYNRDQRLKERAVLMQHWADLCDELRRGPDAGGELPATNVVAMRK